MGAGTVRFDHDVDRMVRPVRDIYDIHGGRRDETASENTTPELTACRLRIEVS
jgi:hypothetical protein